jgi:hypothetical protein
MTNKFSEAHENFKPCIDRMTTTYANSNAAGHQVAKEKLKALSINGKYVACRERLLKMSILVDSYTKTRD